MESNANPKITFNYYIVCRPICYTKDDIAGVFSEIKNKFPKQGHVYHVFLNKDQAMLDASQFSTREVPSSFFNDQLSMERQKLAKPVKPVICLTLDSPIQLTDKSESLYFMNGKKIPVISYQTTVSALKQWQDSSWSILLDGEEYCHPDNMSDKNVCVNNKI